VGTGGLAPISGSNNEAKAFTAAVAYDADYLDYAPECAINTGLCNPSGLNGVVSGLPQSCFGTIYLYPALALNCTSPAPSATPVIVPSGTVGCPTTTTTTTTTPPP
jgi:hypothetical protein